MGMRRLLAKLGFAAIVSVSLEAGGQTALEEVSRTDIPGYHIGLAVAPDNSVLVLSPGNKVFLLEDTERPKEVALPPFPDEADAVSISDIAFSDGHLFFSALGKSSLLALAFPDGDKFEERPLNFLKPGEAVSGIIAWRDGLMVGTFGGASFSVSPTDRGTPLPRGTALASTPSEKPLELIIAYGEAPAKRWTVRRGEDILFPVEGFEFTDNLTDIKLIGEDGDGRLFLEATYDLGEDGGRVAVVAVSRDGGIAKAAFDYANLVGLGRRCVVLPDGTVAFLHADIMGTWQIVKLR